MDLLIINIIVTLALAVIAFIDFKKSAVPSFMTTSVILFLVLVFPQNIIWGISGFLFGLLLYEFDFSGGQYVGGVADIKVLAIIGLTLATLQSFAIMMVVTVSLGVLVSVVRHYYYKGKTPKEFPFVPVLFGVYVITSLTVWYLL